MNESYSTNADYALSNSLYEASIKSSRMQGGEYE